LGSIFVTSHLRKLWNIIGNKLPRARRIGREILRIFLRPQGHQVIKELRGVIHVGANTGAGVP
jgi:hypothetical protein